jgi:hypothetical protein
MMRIHSGMNSTKKSSVKPPAAAPFFPLFRALFNSLSLFHAFWVLLVFLKGFVSPQMFKKDGGELFWIL